MQKIIISTLLLLFSTISIAQNGFFGKKTVISIDGILKGNIIYNTFQKNNGYMSGKFDGKERNRLIGGGFNASITHYFSNRIGLGIDFNMVYSNIKTPKYLYTYEETYDPVSGYYIVNHTKTELQEMRMKTMYIMPKFEWKSGGNLPVGIINHIGIGYAGSHIVEGNYSLYKQTNLNVSSSTITGAQFIPVHGLAVEYGVKLRVPITSFMAVNLGSAFRVHLPLVIGFSSFSYDDTSLDDQVLRSMRGSRASYLMDIRAGLSFILF